MVQFGFKFKIFLPQPLESWNYIGLHHSLYFELSCDGNKQAREITLREVNGLEISMGVKEVILGMLM